MTTYINNFLTNEEATDLFNELSNIDWLSVVKQRREQFMATEAGIEYAYGRVEWQNKYVSQLFSPKAKEVLDKINAQFNTDYNVVFLNRYDSAVDNIAYHSDNSPEMDDNHPICVISLGQRRRIETKPKEIKDATETVWLENGSLFIMPKHYQSTHHHRIPKEGSVCKTRISLTFRKYV